MIWGYAIPQMSCYILLLYLNTLVHWYVMLHELAPIISMASGSDPRLKQRWPP